jgi:4-hydroxybutyrate CoA-transferase
MIKKPNVIKLNQIADVMYEKFKNKSYINCYIGSNSATPTASIEALSESIKSGHPNLPFIKMIHLLLFGNVPYVAAGFQDKIKAYAIFSGGGVTKAANEGRAYYLPCNLGNMEEVLLGKGCRYEPDVVILKVTQNEHTNEYSTGLSVEAIHTAIDNAKIVIAEFDKNMPFTLGQSLLHPNSID